ncbi:MAG: hypothetical protein ACJA2P_000349 [Rhodoferax sp.]|jgi:hypothetical protein
MLDFGLNHLVTGDRPSFSNLKRFGLGQAVLHFKESGHHAVRDGELITFWQRR